MVTTCNDCGKVLHNHVEAGNHGALGPDGDKCPGPTVVYVYDLSRLVEIIEAGPRVAWKCGTTAVRAYAREQFKKHDQGYNRKGVWYRTANRVGFSMGQYHCTTKLADK